MPQLHPQTCAITELGDTSHKPPHRNATLSVEASADPRAASPRGARSSSATIRSCPPTASAGAQPRRSSPSPRSSPSLAAHLQVPLNISPAFFCAEPFGKHPKKVTRHAAAPHASPVRSVADGAMNPGLIRSGGDTPSRSATGQRNRSTQRDLTQWLVGHDHHLLSALRSASGDIVDKCLARS